MHSFNISLFISGSRVVRVGQSGHTKKNKSERTIAFYISYLKILVKVYLKSFKKKSEVFTKVMKGVECVQEKRTMLVWKVIKGAKVKMGKRLLKGSVILNTKKCYMLLKKEHATDRVRFSAFCQLRPKWRVIAGKSRTRQYVKCQIDVVSNFS